MTLLDLVERERRGVARHLRVAILGAVAGGVLLVLLSAVLVLGGSRWLTLPRILPFLFWSLALMGAWAAVRWLWRRVAGQASIPHVAYAVEVERSLRAGSLRGVLEVAETGALGRLGAETMTGKLRALGGPSLAPAYRRRVVRRAAGAVAAALVGVLAMVSAAVAAPDGFRAILHPVDAWRGTLLGTLSLGDVPRSVLRGEVLTLTVRAPGRRTVDLAERVTGSSWRTRSLAVSGDSAVVRVGPLDADLSLFATDGRATSDTATVGVVDRPFVGDVTVTAEFPAYLGRRAESIPLGQLARVPRGTSLAIVGQSSTALRAVGLLRDRELVPLRAEGRGFSGRMIAQSSGRYEWKAEGAQGPIADVPPALELDVQPDSAPTVEIISPSRDSLVERTDTIAVSVLATDDHGLASMALRVSITGAGGDVRSTTTRAFTSVGGGQFAGEIGLPMSALVAGDAMRLTAIATDASPWRQVGLSRELVLRLPSASEQRASARASADSAVRRALSAAQAQRQLNQRTADAARARAQEAQRQQGKGDSAMSFEAAEQARQFAKEQRQLADRMQQVQNAARDLEKRLQQAGALDSSLQARLREAQQLMREALTPELAEKLRQLEQASQNLSPEDARKALQDLASHQRKLREQLEKSVEMLKRAALEGSMETLKDEAKDLAARQKELVDSLRKADKAQEQSLAEQMVKEMQEKAKELQKDVQDLQKRLQQEKAEAGAERVREAGEKIDESLEKLQQALQQQGQQQKGQQQQGQQQQGQQQQGQQQQGQQQQGQQQQGQQGQQQQGQQGQQQGAGAKAGDKTDAGASAQQAAEAMEQAAEELDKARQQQVGEWKKELTGELDRSIQEMLQLARQQDQLEQSARQGARPDELRSQQGALQQGVEKALERLQDAGQKSSLLSQRSMRMMTDARRKVQDATAQTQRAQTGQQMASAMRESSESLNQAAASLVRDRERTQGSQSATGFAEMLEQLQQMARQQQGLNSAMQDLIPKSGQQGTDAQAQARELAREQREVATRLDDVADRDDNGRADEMAREARMIAQALESGQLDPAVLERQQRLFRKMLDAGRLLEEEEREDSGKREAKPWTGTEVFTPSGTTASGKAGSRFTAPTWNDLRGLTSDERRLVLEYFKRINSKP